MSASLVGPLLLGSVVGYLTHYLVRRDPSPGIEDLGAIIGTVLGGVILRVLAGADQTNWYLVGVGVGFFLYWIALMLGRETVKSLSVPNRLPLFPFLR